MTLRTTRRAFILLLLFFVSPISGSSSADVSAKKKAERELAYLKNSSALPDIKWVSVGDEFVSIGFESIPRDIGVIAGAAAARGATAVEGDYAARVYKGGAGYEENKKSVCYAYAKYRPGMPGKVKAVAITNSCSSK